jgi:hypothetical protein
MPKGKNKTVTLEEKVKVTQIVATSLDQGHYGFANCGNCGAYVPEPYYKQKKCTECNYAFAGIKKIPYPYGGSDF